MLSGEELRKLRDIWVAGSFPTLGKRECAAALVIDDLIRECFELRERLRTAAKRDLRTLSARPEDLEAERAQTETLLNALGETWGI